MVDIIVKDRDEVITNYKRSYALRLPDADTRDGMQPDINARCCADMVMPCYANAKRLGRAMLLSGRTGDEIDEIGELEGVPRNAAKGASGYVTVRTRSGGAWAFEGDELTYGTTGIVYVCAKTLLYTDLSDVPVTCRETGPTTNLDAGEVLEWSSPRLGMLPKATVKADAQGDGLTGGSDEESDDDYIARIIDARRRRSNSGNDAEYQRQAQQTPGVGVEQAFTYPAILGSGTTGLVFTIKPQTTGGLRIPNSAQSAEVEWHLRQQFPADDGLVMMTIFDESFAVAGKVKWDSEVEPWIDSAPWPTYYASGATPGAVVIDSAADATHFTVECDGGYTGITQPSVGLNLGVYDASHARFARKKILSFTGTGPWVVTCDTAQSASDTSYVPLAGQRVMPWSESLQTLVTPCLTYCQLFGPGECTAAPPLDGQRQLRSPVPTPTLWPYTPGNRLETEMLIDAVQDIRVLSTTPSDTTVGTLGVSVYLLRLTDFALFAWS